MSEGRGFSRTAEDRIAKAVRRVELGREGREGAERGAEQALVARCTGAASGGLYPGVITAWDEEASAWEDFGDCQIKPLNSEALASGTRYPVVPAAQQSSGDLLVLLLAGSGGGSSTVHGVLDGTLTQGSSATLSVYSGPSTDTGANVTVYDFMLASGQTVAAGAHAFAALDATDGLYYVIAAPCS